MEKSRVWKLLKELSKEVCLNLCPNKLMDCPEDCKFQKLLISVLEEIDK